MLVPFVCALSVTHPAEAGAATAAGPVRSAATATAATAPAGDRAPAAPPAMIAIPGGDVDVGDGPARRRVSLAPFFIDRAPVLAGQYTACATDGACPALGVAGATSSTSARVDWASAERFCAWAGKRLPTEAEWETARPSIAPPTTTGAPVLEWTASNFVSATVCRAPGAELPGRSAGTWAKALCGTVDVLDACDGAPFCGSIVERVVKDPGQPRARAAASGRVAFDGDDRGGLGPRHGLRCASSSATLSVSPVVPAKSSLPRPPDPPPPSPAEHALFGSILEDALEVPACETAGRSFIDCRDPRSYLKTNEPRIAVVLPWVKNRGGGYTGVASDQNYTFVAHARSQWVWLFDYDENIVRWHKVLRALVLQATDRHAFVAFFDRERINDGVAAIDRHAAGDPHKANLIALYRGAAADLAGYYRKQAQSASSSHSWLGDDTLYSYIRTLYLQGRMAAFRGNMLDKNTMRTVGDAARLLGVPIRIYYPSNAPEFWPFTDEYRSNVRGLPFDEDSVVVQTISSVSMKTGFGQRSYWHYNVQGARAQQELLGRPGITRLRQLLYHRTKSDSPELTLSDLPGVTPSLPPPSSPGVPAHGSGPARPR